MFSLKRNRLSKYLVELRVSKGEMLVILTRVGLHTCASSLTDDTISVIYVSERFRTWVEF